MSGSISQLIDLAQAGDDLALGALQQRYWSRLVRMARKRMSCWPSRETDSEDVAQNAFISVCESIKMGNVPKIHDRDHFLAFLSHVVACQVVNEFKKRTAVKRGGGSAPGRLRDDLVSGRNRYSPIQSMILKENYHNAMLKLPEPLQPFADLHLAGLSNREISAEMECTERTVERKLSLIRMHWQKLADESLTGDLSELLGIIGR